jgi:hypothetical protein
MPQKLQTLDFKLIYTEGSLFMSTAFFREQKKIEKNRV